MSGNLQNRSIVRYTRPSRPLIAAATILAIYAWLVVISTMVRPGSMGLNYNAPGTDYMVFYAAVSQAISGHISILYDEDRFTALLNHLFGGMLTANLPFRPWIYPPHFLVLLLPFAGLPFLGAYAAFQAVTGALMAASLRAGPEPATRWTMVAALFCPAASINVVDGQASFLVAALLLCGIRALPSAPILSGVAFGLLTFKPQFCLLAPAILIGARSWRAIAAASLTLVSLALISFFWLGSQPWIDWASQTWASNAGADPRWFLYGRAWGHSLYTCAVLLGAGRTAASAVQLIFTGAAFLLTLWAIGQPVSWRAKAAIILPCVLLAAPHWGTYDAVLLMIATSLWIETQVSFAPSIVWGLALVVFAMPLLGPPALSIAARFGPLLTCVVLAFPVHQAAAQRAGVRVDRIM